MVVVLALSVVAGCSGGSGSRGGERNGQREGDANTGPGPRNTQPSSATALPALPEPVPTIWVRADAPEGGDGSQDRPFRAVGQALAMAGPGDAVSVAPGIYRERVRSVRAGTPTAPVRLVGPGAEIRGDGNGRLVQITHDDVTLEGFRLSDAGILVWVHHATRVRIVGNTFSGAAGECLRLRYFARSNEVARNHIGGCGRRGFDLEDDRKNGEGVYIGTAPEQRGENPTDEVDNSGGNWVHDNSIEVPAECVDVKEGARANLVESNDCRGSRDPDGGGLSSRGIGTIFRNNRSTGNAGAGIRLGGDDEGDGIESVVVGNTLVGNGGYGVKVVREPQAMVCGNIVADNGEGPTTDGADDPSATCA